MLKLFFSSTEYENCFKFFHEALNLFFFLQKAKSVSIFFNKMQKDIHFFLQNVKSVLMRCKKCKKSSSIGTFVQTFNAFSFMHARNLFLNVQTLHQKIYFCSACFQTFGVFYLELLIYSHC